MENPLVSTIIPVYNAESFLDQTISSILGQTYKNIELILVDDGSTDQSGRICDYYASKNMRIKSHHIANHGVSYARNYGIEVSHGDYVHFVDADDKIPADFIELMLNSISSKNSDVALCGIARIFEYFEDVHRLDNGIYSVEEFFCKLYKNDRFGTTSACIGLYKMELIREHHIRFPEKLRCGEDTMFVIEYMKYTKKISTVKDTAYCYMYFNENSATRNLYYDYYQQEQWRYDEVCGIIGNIKLQNEISYYYIDLIIRALVTYVKYSPETQKEIKRNLKAFVENSNTQIAISHYHRNSRAKSYWIPVAIKYKMPSILYILLKKRKKNVNVQQKIQSVWI